MILMVMIGLSGLLQAQVPAGINAANAGNGRITGTLLDSVNNQPISFATITLTNPITNKPVDGAMAD